VLIPLFMARQKNGTSSTWWNLPAPARAGRGVPLADIIIGVFAWQFTVQCVNGGLGCI
jgi:hypothetical protein